MLHSHMPSRVFNFFFCFRNFSVTQSSAMKKIWRRSWQCSKVRTSGFPCPFSLTICSEQIICLSTWIVPAQDSLPNTSDGAGTDGWMPPHCLWDSVKFPGEVVFPHESLCLVRPGHVTLQPSCLAAAGTAKPAAWTKLWGAAGGWFLSRYPDKLAGVMHDAVAGLFF